MTQVDVVESMAGISLFADLNAAELEAVSLAFEEETAEEGQRLLRQGFEGNAFYVILSGEADWLVGGHHVDRQATMIGLPPKPLTLKRGDWFGELGALLDGPAIADVIALTPMDLLVLPAEQLRDFLLRNPKIMFRLLQGEVRRLGDPARWR